MTEMNRKEWLEGEINLLGDKALFADLSEQDDLWLGAYKEELEGILKNEN